MSGATFTINIPNGDGVIESQGNSLLHVAIYVKVEINVIKKLLELGDVHSVVVHVNSEGLTPVQYAEKYLRTDNHAMDLRDTILGYYYEHTYNYIKYLTELIEKAILNDRIYNNSIRGLCLIVVQLLMILS